MKQLSVMKRWLAAAAAVLALGAGAASAQDAKPFSAEQLDQMTAQIALYPDSLLSQLLMATTYPEQFAAAYEWSKAHPDAKGDDAVKMVESQGWDPAVASMVGFPEVLITLGAKPDWVRNMGDAFLGQPEDVMNSVQRLRAQAEKAGNLKSNEQIKVSTQAAPPPATTTTVVQQSAPPSQVIVIEPAQPSVVYVPAYNPAYVYGPWMYPAYPPYYYPPPPGYWFSRTVATGIAWGIGIGVSNALWGGMNWGRGDVNINVNRYNNINVNNRIDGNGGNAKWNHNPSERKSSYRGGDATRQKLDKQYQSGSRDQFRGKDGSRDASRQRAAQTMQNKGIDVAPNAARGNMQPSANRGSGDRAQSMDRSAARDHAGNVDRDAARNRAQSASHDNALRGADSNRAGQQMDRGQASQRAAQQRSGGGSSFGGGGNARPSGGAGASRPSGGAGRPSGGGGRPSGGGHGGGGRRH